MNVRPPLALVFTTVATALALLGCGDTRRAPSGLDVDPWLPKTEEELDAMDQRALDEVAEAARFANESPFPDPQELNTDVYISYP